MPRNTISRCAHTTAPLSVFLLHTLVPYFFSFSISSIALSFFTPNSCPFSDNVVSLIPSLFTNIFVFIVSPVLASITLIFLIIISNLIPLCLLYLVPYSLFLCFYILFYFHDLIRRRQRSTCIVHSLAAGSRWEAKPSITPTLLNFFRARVFTGTIRGACAFIARELREGLHLYETQMSNTTSASKQIKRVYIFWNRGSSNFDSCILAWRQFFRSRTNIEMCRTYIYRLQ